MEINNFQEVFPDGEWDFSNMFSGEDQFLGQFGSFSGGDDGGLQFSATQLAFTNANESVFYSLNPDFPFVSQENSSSSNSSSSVFAPNYEHSYFMNDSMSMDFCTVDQKNSNLFFPPEISLPKNVFVSENVGHSDHYSSPSPKESQLKRKLDFPESEADPPENATKKKTRVTRDAMKTKKNEKATKNSSPKNKKEELESTSNGSSEEDNASNEALNSSGKPRASRGSATDPQSLYARKRRERINERLRILQNLVPNGAKVDISTMLEEAVQYVKFLQLQIKLLSSDDLWMYAPIAYNGMDIGLNQKLSLLL